MSVPKLRFTQFSGDWQQFRTDQLGIFRSGYGFPDSEQGGDTGVPFYKVSDMNIPGNSEVMVRANNYVTEEQIKRLKYKPIVNNGIIFAKVGAAIFLDRKRKAKNFLLDNNMMAFLPGEELDFEFIYQKFMKLKLSRFAQVGALPSYNASDIGIIKITIPSLPEQQKIASFLSSVDKKIDLLRQKKNELELYKKGLMQKIFSQEIRFKQDDGSDFPDWEEVALGEVGEFSSAGVDKKIVPSEEEVRLLNFTNVYKQNRIFDGDLNQVVTAPMRKIEQCNVRKGDIFFTPSSETRNDIGLSAVAAEDMHGVVYSYHVIRFRLQVEWDFNFSCFAFDRSEFRKQCYLAGDGSGQRYVISQNAFRQMILSIPCLEEQRKIGFVLSAIDSKIQKTSSQIEQMETFKTGLLQQMFV